MICDADDSLCTHRHVECRTRRHGVVGSEICWAKIGVYLILIFCNWELVVVYWCTVDDLRTEQRVTITQKTLLEQTHYIGVAIGGMGRLIQITTGMEDSFVSQPRPIAYRSVAPIQYQ